MRKVNELIAATRKQRRLRGRPAAASTPFAEAAQSLAKYAII